MYNLDGKVIIVTGGCGLIGKGILSKLESGGANAINFDLDIETDLTQGKVNCNITSSGSIKESLGLVIDTYGKIDGLVNNAFPRTNDWGKHTWSDTSIDSFKTNVDWQLNSYANLVQEVAKKMRSNSGCSIVNIASIYGVVGNDFTIYENTEMKPEAAYSAVKGGLINLSRYLASYYGKEGIRVNCLSPGGIFDHQDPIFVKNYESRVPLRRMGNPDDIAGPVCFLLSEEAKYITGHNLIVDGGWTSI